MKTIITIFLILSKSLIFISNAQTPQLWGMTNQGGSNNQGAIIKINEDGSNFQTVFSFDTISGINPNASLLLASNGKFYGTTILQGVNNSGTLFSLDTTNFTTTVVHDFIDSTGSRPKCSLIQATNGKLYGTTTVGGANNHGAIFSFNPTTNIYADLYDFSSVSTQILNKLIQANNGLLYGMLYRGGLYTHGYIFSYNISTSVFTNIHDFNDTLGKWPEGSLIQANNGKLYGMTYRGGINNGGVIFSIDINTNLYSVLYNFNSSSGFGPTGNLLQANNGIFYGMTLGGGFNTAGVLFSFNSSSNAYDTLFNLNSASGGDPNGTLIQGSNGKLFGMTSVLGANSDGVIFSYDIATDTYTNMHDFNGTDGNRPFGDLLEVIPSTVGIPVVKTETGIRISPNPSNTLITFHKVNFSSSETLIISDVLGNRIYQQTISAPDTKIDVSKWSAGVYFYELREAKHTSRGKFIVQQ